MHEEEGRLIPSKEEAEAEATSKETVSDLKESGTTSTKESSGEGVKGSTSPSPDGQFDTPREGKDDAGPM
jgi:hypothetical protein